MFSPLNSTGESIMILDCFVRAFVQPARYCEVIYRLSNTGNSDD